MEGRRRMKEEKQEEGRRKDEEGGGSRRKRMEEGGNEERKGSKRERRRKKSRERKADDGTGNSTRGVLGTAPFPFGGRGEEGRRRIWGLSGSFQAHFIGENETAPNSGENPKPPPRGPQNSPGTSQNLWEGSLYTFLQPTPNPKISEYL